MESGRENPDHVILFLGGELGSADSTRICRICHGEEEGQSSSMESPCSCSGSLRFAHRDCVQRWCDAKGSTVCEICLKGYEPGYTVVPQKKPVVDVGLSIRRNIEVTSSQDYGPQELEYPINRRSSSDDNTHINTSSTSAKGTFYCRSIYMILATILLIKHLINVVALGAKFHASTLLIVFILRASGIIFPIFIIMKLTLVVIEGLKSKE